MSRASRAEPGERLLAARRSLEGHPRAHIAGELLWFDKESLWAFPVDLTIDSADTALVPRTSRWYVVIDPRYPWGAIDIYPAKSGGIDTTFPHQDHNGEGDEKAPWREGDICVRAPDFALGRRGQDPDPKGSDNRITWYVDRAVEWLERASRNELFKPGDDFELPQFKPDFATVGFSEDADSFVAWATSDAVCGTVELVGLGTPFPFAARRFFDLQGTEVHAASWGRMIRESKTSTRGAWIRLPQPPVLPPYAAPMRWGELFSIMESVGMSPASVLQPALRPLRDGLPHVLMVGFPIPRHIGEAPSVIHWQPLQLPDLSHGSKPRKGFSPTDKGYWGGDLVSCLGPKKPIAWLSAQNWNDSEMGTRGRLCPALTSKRVLLLGAGAIGASMAELLIRGGVRRVVVLDSDSVQAGNLVRHTLALPDVGRGKAEQVALRLNAISPHADVEPVSANFPRLGEHGRQRANECDLVLDCTGSDDVLQALAEDVRSTPVDFASVAMGRGAKRLYLYCARGTSFPVESFRDALTPWLTTDAAEFKDLEFPWEGIGCWHPVFPATADQVALFAAAAVGQINGWVNANSPTSELVVLETGTGVDVPILRKAAASA